MTVERTRQFLAAHAPDVEIVDTGADTTTWLVASQPRPAGGGLWMDRRERPTSFLGRTKPTSQERRRIWTWTADALDLTFGRVVSVGPSTIRYEGYPNAAGTELIRYEVQDRFGATSQAFVRVGVVTPGDPQPPVAVEDEVVAAPGKRVTAHVLRNDLIARGVTPVVTYHHFTTPRWVAHHGGWEEPDTIDRFARFCERVTKHLGDRIGRACTINEPNMVATGGYLSGGFPPGRRDPALRRWIRSSRLDGFGKVVDAVRPDETDKLAVLARLRNAAMPAAANLRRLVS